MNYREYTGPTAMLYGYDPVTHLPDDHLARLVESVVEVAVPKPLDDGPGNPAYDPRLLLKVLAYGYATGLRSSRQLEQQCGESLPYLYLTRGAKPSYRTLCSFRVGNKELIEKVWTTLFAVADGAGIPRLGRITLDSFKIRADIGADSVVSESDYDSVKDELKRILKQAQEQDEKDGQEPPGATRTGKSVPADQMREILRRIRANKGGRTKTDQATAQPAAPCDNEASRAGAPAPPPPTDPPSEPANIGPRMPPRVQAAIQAIEAAREAGQKQVCLTDPDAIMMYGGRPRRIVPCHSFEVAVDNGLIVAGQTTQEGADSSRLTAIVKDAKANEPSGVSAVDADSGYFSAEGVLELVGAGIDTCIPDTHAACDLHRGNPIGTSQPRPKSSIDFTYNEGADEYTCPRGNVLARGGSDTRTGRRRRLYLATRDCVGCPLAKACLGGPNTVRRSLTISEPNAKLVAAKDRFNDPDHQARYHHRGEAVETVNGFLRGTLGYTRWLLRGSEAVASEGALFKLAYQIRKVHTQLKRANYQPQGA